FVPLFLLPFTDSAPTVLYTLSLHDALPIFMQTKNFPLIFERSKTGRTAYALSETDIPTFDIGERIGKEFVREEPADLPEVSELELIRHYTALSNRNFGIDSGFYPLGSC